MDCEEVSQPRHLPGYTGHQPTMQSRIGETFGNISHEIFQNTDLPRARRLSDTQLAAPVTSTPVRGGARPNPCTSFAERIDRLNFSNVSTPEDIRGGHHLPGYSGHVPTMRDRMGQSYANLTYTVMREANTPRARRLSDVTPLPQRNLTLSRSDCHLPGYSGHVPTAAARVGETYGDTTHAVLHDSSIPQSRRLADTCPLRPNVDEHLGRTPGYGGHVPSLAGRVGGTYGRDTSALITDRTVYQGRTLSQTNIGNNSMQENPLEPSFMPGYSGHVPGLQDRVSETYGRSTHGLMTDHATPVPRRMSDVTPGGRVMVNRQEAVITMVQEPGNFAESEAAQPHHVPGYTGFVPQYHHRIGDTYGRTTHELFLDPSVDHARQLALSDRSTDDYQIVTETQTATRTIQEGTTPISRRPAVPGYDAFVSRMRGKRGQRFSINVRQTNTQQEITRRPKNVSGRQLTGTEFIMPLQEVTPVFRRRWPALEERVKTTPESPYFMDIINPDKKFITGYTGHIPFYNVHIGLHNAAFTNSALCDFTSNYRKRQSTEWAPVDIVRPDPPLFEHRAQIYHKNTPLIPNYAGHVPGSKFRSGLTFGNDSRDAARALRGDRY